MGSHSKTSKPLGEKSKSNLRLAELQVTCPLDYGHWSLRPSYDYQTKGQGTGAMCHFLASRSNAMEAGSSITNSPPFMELQKTTHYRPLKKKWCGAERCGHTGPQVSRTRRFAPAKKKKKSYLYNGQDVVRKLCNSTISLLRISLVDFYLQMWKAFQTSEPLGPRDFFPDPSSPPPRGFLTSPQNSDENSAWSIHHQVYLHWCKSYSYSSERLMSQKLIQINHPRHN